MSEPPIYKVLLVGDGNVGKTSLVRRFCEDKFDESRILTIGVDFQIKIVEVDGRAVKLSIWDIAGQERFGAFRDSFYRGARAVALVYDVSNPVSLETLPRWQAEVSRVCSTAKFVVVGNKLDLGYRVSREQVEEWASSMGYPYLETSALTAQGVEGFFLTLARLAMAKGK